MSSPGAEAVKTLTGTAVDDALCSRIEALARQSFGSCTLVGWRPLNSQSHLRVARITLDLKKGGAAATAIAKFADPASDPTSTGAQRSLRRYANERATYALLMRNRAAFDRFPCFLGQDADLILLEDLGASVPVSHDAIATALVDTLATLHGTTVDLKTGDLADSSIAELTDAFERSSALLADQAEILIGLSRDYFGRLVAQVRAELASPGPVTALLHCDVADLRQTVWKPPVLYLLDFEWARIGDPLYDLATLLIGKAEYLLKPAMLLYNRLPLPPDIPSLYRRRWEAMGGPPFDTAWDRRLAANLVYAAFVALTAFHRAGTMPSFTALAQTQKLILNRLRQTAPAGTPHDELIQRLGALAARIV